MGILEAFILILILAFVFWLLSAYVVPLLPHPFGRILLAILAIIAIVALLVYFFGGSGSFGGSAHHRGEIHL